MPGLKCPKCGEGDIGEKRTRRGKPFWGCTRYPECDWSSWDRPTSGPCPECNNSLLVQKSTKTRGDYIKCPSCNTEFTRADDGSLEHAAAASTSAPLRSPRRGGLKKKAPVKSAVGNGAAVQPAAAAKKSAPEKPPAQAKKSTPAKAPSAAAKKQTTAKASAAKKKRTTKVK
jgi:DNA topoisomerase-1